MSGVAPDRDRFLALAEAGCVVPIVREILADLDTPVGAFLKMEDGRSSFLLESVEGGEQWGRYSFIGFSPRWVFKSLGNRVSIESVEEGVREETVSDPLDALRRLLHRYRAPVVSDLPRFFGGAVGYLGYGLARFWERLPSPKGDALGAPESLFMVGSDLVIFDNVRKTIKVVCLAFLDPGRDPLKVYGEALKRMEALVERLSLPVPRSPKRAAGKAPEISSWLDRARYKEKVLRAKEHIACGDVIQVVVSQRFEAETCVDPFVLYRAIRAINPSPYLFFLRMGDFSLIGSSPEVMVRVEEGQVTVRPIAGTRPRGADEEQDRRLEQDLRSDPKEKAEHIMLVDLGRNDVGRVAEIGSVRVTECMAVERYSHVMHLVSNVTGRLRAGLDAFDALRATFPAGTLTGAPKIRAMEIIHDLEDVGRGFYGGAVGYIGLTGNLDTCIAIRTMMAKNGKVFFQTGAGIVADSDPDREHQECLDKAMGLVKALEMAEEGF